LGHLAFASQSSFAVRNHPSVASKQLHPKDIGETLVFQFKDWLTEVQMIDMLQRLQDDLTNWGDIYFRRLE